MEEIRGFVTLFDNCCHGGTRKKATAWWVTVYCFLQLVHDVMFHSSMKDGNPELINGQVVARLEAAYPILLCERLAAIAKVKTLELGAFQVQHWESRHSMHHLHSISLLPRGRKFEPLAFESVFTKNGRYRFHMVP